MTARLTLGLAMVLLQFTLYATGASDNILLTLISLAYFVSTLTSGLFAKPRFLGTTFNPTWLRLVGIDILAFSCLQVLQGSNINYTPLFALPILLASVLGSLRLALGTAAGITVALLGGTLWSHWGNPAEAAAHLAPVALSGVGYFAMAILANQLATRLASEGLRARRSQSAVNLQQQVNALVIQAFPDGVLIVDASHQVRAANPAARRLLGANPVLETAGFSIEAQTGWSPLVELTQLTLESGSSQIQEVTIRHAALGPQRIRVTTHLTAAHATGAESLCVLFLQDQRELEARMRTEKLASMGRLSTAVAHEIRNPLASITQANALLEEELTDPRQQRLSRMVRENAQRLANIVTDILSASHISPATDPQRSPRISLNPTVLRMCNDWARQHQSTTQVHTSTAKELLNVHFDSEHLQRILVNLLDNAKRYAQPEPQSIQVHVQPLDSQSAEVCVWSYAAPMDQSVERHLFEPFFSSESRSSGLGLYICRELCKAHNASIDFRRSMRWVNGVACEGNAFILTFPRANAALPA